jgi:hypothetical protein
VNIGARVTAFSSGIPAQPTEAIDGKHWLFHAPATVSFEVEPSPSSAVGAGSENSFRGERFFQRGGLRGKLIFLSDVVPNTPL